MRKVVKKYLLITLGWFFVILGIIGALLPVLPTTPFLILALALFSKSSPKFHQMLLNNKWLGSTLRQWEETRTMERKSKYKAYFLIVLFFSISIFVLHDNIIVQLLLTFIAVALILFIWSIKTRQNF